LAFISLIIIFLHLYLGQKLDPS